MSYYIFANSIQAKWCRVCSNVNKVLVNNGYARTATDVPKLWAMRYHQMRHKFSGAEVIEKIACHRRPQNLLGIVTDLNVSSGASSLWRKTVKRLGSQCSLSETWLVDLKTTLGTRPRSPQSGFVAIYFLMSEWKIVPGNIHIVGFTRLSKKGHTCRREMAQYARWGVRFHCSATPPRERTLYGFELRRLAFSQHTKRKITLR